MTISIFLDQLKQYPEKISFQETIALIEENYTFVPTAFDNGELQNAAGENSGSCKLFAFAQLQDLSPSETLTCFGAFYYADVLGAPEAMNHQNIRNFMKTAWVGIVFHGNALTLKDK